MVFFLEDLRYAITYTVCMRMRRDLLEFNEISEYYFIRFVKREFLTSRILYLFCFGEKRVEGELRFEFKKKKTYEENC